MARGRFISQEITKDKKINSLSDDTSRLAFTWLVTMADCEGRTYGDPAIVRSMVFPRRSDVTVQRMETYILEWHNSGMVIWYESEGDMWIAFPNFEKHQVGLRKDKEAPSVIPPPPENENTYSVPTPELVQSNSVLDTDENGLIKEKLIKDEVDDGGIITPFRKLSAAVVEYGKVGEYSGGAKKWNDSIKQMLTAGAEPIDIRSCVEDYTRKGMQIKDAGSLVNGVIIAVSKRKREADINPLGGYSHG